VEIVPNDPQAVHEGIFGHTLDDADVAVPKAAMPCLEVGRLVSVASRNRHHHTLLVIQVVNNIDLV
jgi:hypothetical protein